MPGCPRYFACVALAALGLAQPACSADPAAHPAFAGGKCPAGQEDYQGFCLPAGSNSDTSSRGVTGRSGTSGSSDTGGSGGTAPPGTGGSAPGQPDGGPNGSTADGGAANDAGGGRDAGTISPPDCQPQTETCDDADEDCDGRIDEHTDVACFGATTGCTADGSGDYACTGLCRAGVRRCSEGELGACEGEVPPAAAEACTTGGARAADENCDGRVDEDCQCTAPQACYSGEDSTQGVGPCRAGTQACEGGRFGACAGEVLPSAETCANMEVDDDCDGVLDDVPRRGNPCTDPSRMGPCASGTLQCMAGELVCVTPSPAAETCDRRDQDCDGDVDEDFDLETDARHCGMCGSACSDGQRCCGGTCVDVASTAHCGACGMACASGQMCCAGSCRDLQSDAAHCGACGEACGADQSCCGGVCVDTRSNARHCGSCGNDCGSTPATGCCDGTCQNLNTDERCGSCTNACDALLEGCCEGNCELLQSLPLPGC